MDQSWVVAAGHISLYLYCLLILAMLGGLAARGALMKHRSRVAPPAGSADVSKAGASGGPAIVVPLPPRAHRWSAALRLFVEYVGNLDSPTRTTAEIERRRNRQARILMEHIKNDLAGRDIPPAEKEDLVERLRESIQSVEPEQAG